MVVEGESGGRVVAMVVQGEGEVWVAMVVEGEGRG